MAQFDAVAGDFEANKAEHERLIDEAGGRSVDVLVFPELSLSGYARNTLNERPGDCVIEPEGPGLHSIRAACRRNGLVAALGGVLRNAHGFGLSTIVIDRQGEVCASYHKQHLDGPDGSLLAKAVADAPAIVTAVFDDETLRPDP